MAMKAWARILQTTNLAYGYLQDSGPVQLSCCKQPTMSYPHRFFHRSVAIGSQYIADLRLCLVREMKIFGRHIRCFGMSEGVFGY